MADQPTPAKAVLVLLASVLALLLGWVWFLVWAVSGVIHVLTG